MAKLKYIIIDYIDLLMQAARPFLGRSGVCIYGLSCPDYARMALRAYRVPKALALIGLRVISCNPLTALYWKVTRRTHS